MLHFLLLVVYFVGKDGLRDNDFKRINLHIRQNNNLDNSLISVFVAVLAVACFRISRWLVFALIEKLISH